jgi:hypothetical protein
MLVVWRRYGLVAMMGSWRLLELCWRCGGVVAVAVVAAVAAVAGCCGVSWRLWRL